jgi:hypothetical protein
MLRGERRQGGGSQCPVLGQEGAVLRYQGGTRMVPDQCQRSAGARGVQAGCHTITRPYTNAVPPLLPPEEALVSDDATFRRGRI